VPQNGGMGWPSGFVPKSKAYGAGEREFEGMLRLI